MRQIHIFLSLFCLLLLTACISQHTIDETDPETFAYLVSKSPYKNLEDPAYVQLPRSLRVKSGTDVFIIDKVGLDPRGNALYVYQKKSSIIVGKGFLYPAYDQTGKFTGILNGNTGTINLMTDENFPTEYIHEDVIILFYLTTDNTWIKIPPEQEK